MSRIEIRGVIVPSEYDIEWMQQWIDKGLITPESTFRTKLAEASTAEPLDVYVNSPGGSVFAAYEMINAVREWKADNEQTAVVTVGAMAASAASTFAISAATTVRAHKNAKMMFHGSSVGIFGGKQALEDEAELLGKIDADVQRVLVTKYNMDPDMVAEWFAEGRQGWLTAEEMVETGIAAEMISDDSDVIDFDPDAINAIEEHGLKIAAVLNISEVEKEEEADAGGDAPGASEVDDTAPEEEEPDSESVGGSESAHAEQHIWECVNCGLKFETDLECTDVKCIECEGDLQKLEELPEAKHGNADYERGHADGESCGRNAMAAEYADQIAELQTRAEEAEALTAKHQGEKDKLYAQLQKEREENDVRANDLRTQLDEVTARLQNYLTGSLKFSPPIETWEEAMAACGDDYAEAKKQYPDLCERFKADRRARK